MSQNLTEIDLSLANLLNSRFNKSNLVRAQFYGSNMARVNFDKANLRGAYLQNVNLEGAIFTNAILSGVTSGEISGQPASLPTGWILRNGYLIGPGANLENATLKGADLSGAQLTGANLSGVKSGEITGQPASLPTGWILRNGHLIGPRADLKNSILTGADLSGALLTRANLENSILTGADLSGALLTRANLENSILTGADLSGALLEEAELLGIVSGAIRGLPESLPAQWIIRNGYLIGQGANLKNANLDNLELSSAQLYGVTSGGIQGSPDSLPSGWVLHAGNLVGPGVNLKNVNFQNANLGRVNFTGADLGGSNLENTNLNQASMGNVKSGEITGIPSSLPSGWILRAGYLIGVGADLSGANLEGVDLSDVTFSNITPTNLSGANLRRVNLNNLALGRSHLVGVKSGEITGVPSSLPTGWILRAGYLIGPGANLENAVLDGEDLAGVKSGGIIGIPKSLPTGWILRNGYLIGPGANLEFANLSEVDLSGVNLQGARLSGANLLKANLVGVRSGNVYASTAPRLPLPWKLFKGYIVGPGSNLTGANLRGFDFNGLELGASSLVGANLDRARFGTVNLADVISASIVGVPSELPPGWRISNGMLVSKLKFASSPLPRIQGYSKIGSTLTATLGGWSPTPGTVKFEWFRGDRATKIGAGKSLYINSGLVGTLIYLKATVSRSGFDTTIRWSRPTSHIPEGVFSSTSKPQVSGSAIIGALLRAKMPKDKEPTTVSFEWFEDSEPLNYAGPDLLLTGSELGKRISVRVTVSKKGFVSYSRFSDETSPVAFPKLPKFSKPEIRLQSGKRYIPGTVLVVRTGDWTAGTRFTYRWIRSGVSIPEATNSTYSITDQDIGKKISLELTGELAGYSPKRSISMNSVPVVMR